MRRSWLGLQLVLSCALLLAVVAVEGRHFKEEESSSEEERPCEKRHHCVEECCETRCHHEDECCYEKRCHHEEDCCCEKRCHHEDECCCEKRCHHEEDCCCEKRCHHEEDCCCEKRCHHEDEECCKKKHSHGKEESGKKKHSHGKEESGKKKHSHVGKKGPKKRRPHLGEWEEASSEKASSDSSEFYESMAKREQQRLAEEAAQTFDPVSPRWREKAVSHLNRGSGGIYYKHLEDGQLEYKKAIGVMVYVNILLGKTNCTKTEGQEEAGVEYSRAYLEEEGCQLPPQLKQEKHNCTFGVFIDMRTEKKAVVSQDCTVIPGIKELSKPLKSLKF